MIAVTEISPEQRDKILAAEESHFLDLKSTEIKPAKLSRTISAFANASGGEVYVGVEEDLTLPDKVRTWRGFKDQEAANAHIQVIDGQFPLRQGVSFSFLSCPGALGLVLQIQIDKTRAIVNATDGVPYLRRGAQNLAVDTPDALARLRLDKGIESFERETFDAPITIITTSAPITAFIQNVVPSQQPQEWLERQLLIRDSKPTVAGILLFADEPQAVLPKHCGIKVYRYKTSAAEGTRETLAFQPLSIEGCLYDQIRAAVRKTTDLIEDIQKLGAKGLEPVKYPFEALHEIVTNAVLHRDYSVRADIHIRIFDNRIEVESPGRLPGHITRDNILREQFARNGAIVRITAKFPDPPNKDVGEGLNTAFMAMSKLRLKPPIIDERENSVLVQIRHESLASPEESIMEYLSNHDEIMNRIGRQITGIASENSMKDIFYKMRDRGLIEQVPGKKGFNAAWRRVKK